LFPKLNRWRVLGTLGETLAILRRGVSMAILKCTFCFNWQSRAGWTETFYGNFNGSPSPTQVAAAVSQWAAERARVLTANATILFCRSSDVTTPRKVKITYLAVKGTLGAGLILNNIQPDVVNVAQLVSFNSTGDSRRFYLQRGLDDRDVVDGKITYEQNGLARSRRFWDFLKNDNWSMRDFTKSDQIAVSTVDGRLKTLTAGAAIPWANNSLILIESRTVGNGLKVRWQGRMFAKNGQICQLKGYRFGDTEGGVASLLTPTYPDLQDWTIPEPNWARTRQTGRPFDLPRGRAPKRT
jgi:hypothetical protein